MHWTHNLDPIFFSLGPIKIHWYGMMYVVGFVLGGWLARRLIAIGFFNVPKKKVDSLATILFICMFVGARLFYVFIYNWDYYSHNFGEIFSIWRGGLSFHGALVGIVVSIYIFARKNNVTWMQTADVVALGGAPGLFFGRMGNFINGELFGKRTDLWMGIIFPNGGPYPRHPSQLYEAVMEGLVLSVIMWCMLKKAKYYGLIGSTFIIGYGVFRFIVEFFREPDPQMGYFFGWMTMGQILCVLMTIGGFFYLFWARKLQLSINWR